jgi:hypothetical protein
MGSGESAATLSVRGGFLSKPLSAENLRVYSRDRPIHIRVAADGFGLRFLSETNLHFAA